tara:strand:+ start:133 stop:702 length:570 start_codon:yes stop_codon:yes gene_type:complete
MSSIDLENSIKKHIKGSQPAPVHLWNPPFCGDLDIHINSKGQWFYQKSEITRERLIRLFSNILKKEGEKYFLVTPVEKVGITVDDVPFIANEIFITSVVKENLIKFQTNVGDFVTLDELDKFYISFKKETGEPNPYVRVRENLFAKIDRKCFYRLIDLCSNEKYKKQSYFGFWSNKTFFPITESLNIDF